MNGCSRRSPGRLALWTLTLTLLLSAPQAAVAEESNKLKVKATTELQLGVLYDDNAALGRRGQFGADQVYDVTSVLGVNSRIQTDLRDTIRFVLTGKLRSEEGRWRQYLRNTDVQLKPSFEFDVSKNLTLTPSLSFKLHRETEEIWGYLEFTPSLSFILYTTKGLVIEGGYDFKATLYDSNELTNTYANVDQLSHLAKLKVKIWAHKKLRLSVKAEVEHQSFGDNIEEKLADIMFLPIEQFEDPNKVAVPWKRKDLFVRGELSALFLAHKYVGIAIGYNVEYDHSNIDAFDAFSHGPRLAAVLATKKHEAFVEGRLSFYDFMHFRFDTRYEDTRKDLKLEAFGSYAYKITDAWKVGLKVTFLSNFSNDALTNADGSFRFDPRHSRSYSRYQGTRIEAMLSYTWDTQTGEAPKKPEPRIPGTIMAQR
ncbi:MAG: hypothetical protein ABI333_00330 [bacterium]